jgi:phytoene dehydrogenase-like protein
MQAALMSILADFVVRPSQFPGLGIPAVNPEPAFDSRVPLEVSRSGRQPSYRNVIGGVNALVGVMAGEIAKAGGVIRTGTPAAKILIEDGKVKGVKTGDGSVRPADVVISSGGAKEVFHELVGPGNLPKKFLKMVDELPLMESIFMVHLGVDFDPVPLQKGALCYYYLTYDIEGGIEHVQSGWYHEGKDGFLVYVPSAHSPGMAPPGRHAVTVYTIAPSELGEGTWEARKEEFADKLLAEAENYVPGLKEHTLVRVILTPDDFKKRTHCKHHSFGGFAPVMGKKGIPFKTPVKGLWFVGSQSESGAGLNSVLEGTWRCIRLIRKDLGA